MTFSHSGLLIEFLSAAKNGDSDDPSVKGGKDFDVLVCETAPNFSGHKTATDLQKNGISAKLITDSSIYAFMSRVDKVIISTAAIMANGGLVAHSGAF